MYIIYHYSLRRRLKAQHEVITSQSARLAYLQANVEKSSSVQDHSTGQSEQTILKGRDIEFLTRVGW